MPDKHPAAKPVRRQQFQSDAEYIAALIRQGRIKEADDYAAAKGLQ